MNWYKKAIGTWDKAYLESLERNPNQDTSFPPITKIPIETPFHKRVQRDMLRNEDMPIPEETPEETFIPGIMPIDEGVDASKKIVIQPKHKREMVTV